MSLNRETWSIRIKNSQPNLLDMRPSCVSKPITHLSRYFLYSHIIFKSISKNKLANDDTLRRFKVHGPSYATVAKEAQMRRYIIFLVLETL